MCFVSYVLCGCFLFCICCFVFCFVCVCLLAKEDVLGFL